MIVNRFRESLDFAHCRDTVFMNNGHSVATPTFIGFPVAERTRPTREPVASPQAFPLRDFLFM